MSSQPVELRKLRDFGQVIGDTFEFLKQNFKQLMSALLVICGLFLLINVITSVFQTLKMTDIYQFGIRPIQGDEFQTNTLSYITSVFLNALVLLLTQACIHLVTLCYISVYLQKNKEKPTL